MVRELKEQYGVRYIYCWHALMGFWAGVAPDSQHTAKYQPRLVYPKPTPSILVRRRPHAVDPLFFMRLIVFVCTCHWAYPAACWATGLLFLRHMTKQGYAGLLGVRRSLTNI